MLPLRFSRSLTVTFQLLFIFTAWTVASPLQNAVDHELDARSTQNSPCPATSCNVKGWELPFRFSRPYWTSKDPKYAGAGLCAARCASDSKCASFATGPSSCRNYGRSIKCVMIQLPWLPGPYKFSNKCCAKKPTIPATSTIQTFTSTIVSPTSLPFTSVPVTSFSLGVSVPSSASPLTPSFSLASSTTAINDLSSSSTTSGAPSAISSSIDRQQSSSTTNTAVYPATTDSIGVSSIATLSSDVVSTVESSVQISTEPSTELSTSDSIPTAQITTLETISVSLIDPTSNNGASPTLTTPTTTVQEVVPSVPPVDGDTPLEPGDILETFAEAIELEPAPTATLALIPAPGINLAGFAVLTPNKTTSFWYNGGQDEGGEVTAKVSVDYSYPSLNLDNSMYILDVTCVDGQITGRFDMGKVNLYVYALQKWPQNSGFLLITAKPNCAPAEGENLFFLATSVSFQDSDQSFTASGTAKALSEVAETMSVDFGDPPVDSEPDIQFGSGSFCGSPGSDTVLGLPAVDCGTKFDQDLDDKLGYYSQQYGSEEEILRAASPVKIDVSGVVKLRHRGFFNIFSSLVIPLIRVVHFVPLTVMDIFYRASQIFVPTARPFVSNSFRILMIMRVPQTEHKYPPPRETHGEAGITIPIYLGPAQKDMVDSPWGKAIKLYSYIPNNTTQKWRDSKASLNRMKPRLLNVGSDPSPIVDVYCVDCSIRGSLQAKGSVTLSLGKELTKAVFELNGRLSAGSYLGVNALAEFQRKYIATLFQKNLYGWEARGVFSVGPTATLKTDTRLGITSEGQMLSGAELNWPHVAIGMDMRQPANSPFSGFVPEARNKFQAYGELAATATVSLPIHLELQVSFLGGIFKKSISVVDTPSLRVAAEYSVAAGSISNRPGPADCYGTGYDTALQSFLTLESTEFDSRSLLDVNVTAAQSCIAPDQVQTPHTSTGGSPFMIEKVMFAGLDITQQASDAWNQGDQIVIDTNTLNRWGDPHEGVVKAATMLYQYNGEERTAIFSEYDNGGRIVIQAGPLNSQFAPYSTRRSTWPQQLGVTDMRIVEISWGNTIIRENNKIGNVYDWYRRDMPFVIDQRFWGLLPWTGAWIWTVFYKDTRTGQLLYQTAPDWQRIKIPRLTPTTVIIERSLVVPAIHQADENYRRQENDNRTLTATPMPNEPTATPTLPTLPASNNTSNSTVINIVTSNVNIQDASNNFALLPSKANNLVATLLDDAPNAGNFTSGASFSAITANDRTFVVGDSNGNYLHYYPDVMASHGVSRLRLAAVNALPKGSKLIQLVDVQGALVALNAAGNYFFTVLCAVEGGLSQVFLVKDVDAGMQALQVEDMKFVVTGAHSSNCGPIALVISQTVSQ